MVVCGLDACLNNKPRNAVRNSVPFEAYAEKEGLFKFTYKGECYLSETEAFCDKGQVVHFDVPSKSPLCEPWSEFIDPQGIAFSVKLECDEGYTEDPARHLCVPSGDF